jgi:hypothetical protein
VWLLLGLWLNWLRPLGEPDFNTKVQGAFLAPLAASLRGRWIAYTVFKTKSQVMSHPSWVKKIWWDYPFSAIICYRKISLDRPEVVVTQPRTQGKFRSFIKDWLA